MKTVSDTYVEFLALLDDVVVEGEKLKEMLADGQVMNFLEQTPDHWLNQAMKTLRHSAVHLLDYKEFRKGITRTIAVLFASLLRGDREYKASQMPLPESLFGKE